MHRTILISAVLALSGALGAVALSQEEEPAAKTSDLKALIERLGHSDYAVRKAAEDQILALGPKAIAGLEEAKREHPDAHVRYEAERLLGRIAAAPGTGERELAEPSRPPAGQSPGQMRDRMNEWLRKLTEQGVLDEDYLENLRKLAEGSGPLQGFMGSMSGSVSDGDRKIDWQRQMDGRIRVSITRDGETQTFEAESLEELREKSPEAYEAVKPHLGRMQVRIGGFDDEWFRRMQDRNRDLWKRFFEFPRRPGRMSPLTPRPLQPAEPAPGGFHLGVWITEVPEVLREHLGLRPGFGVLVEDVVEGSIADRMGLERMDILRTLNGEKITSAEEIRAIIKTLAAGEKIEAGIIRKGQPQKLMSTR